jgi:hypothetical protein
MAVAVGFHPDALEESAAAERWYRERSDAAAAAFVGEIDRAVVLIGELPSDGRVTSAERNGLFCVGSRLRSSFARDRRAPRSSLSRMVGDVPATGSTVERRVGSRSAQQPDQAVGPSRHAPCLRKVCAGLARSLSCALGTMKVVGLGLLIVAATALLVMKACQHLENPKAHYASYNEARKSAQPARANGCLSSCQRVPPTLPSSTISTRMKCG